MAAGSAFFSNGGGGGGGVGVGGGGGGVVSGAPWMMDSDAEMNSLYRDLELGTVLTLFYSKKSQRPERRTFLVKLETRTIVWTRGTDKIEGESE